MAKKLPFLVRFSKRQLEDPRVVGDSGYYSEEHDLHVKMEEGEETPLILTNAILLETKTITMVRGERED